jgi:hypothetical protein
MTCSDFVRIDDGVKPEIVYWLATKRAKAGIVIDVDATDAYLRSSALQGRPTASLQKVKAKPRLGKKL